MDCEFRKLYRCILTLILGGICAVSYADDDSKRLYINEVMVANLDGFIDPSFNYGGWVELYNPTDENVLLANCTIRQIRSNETVENSKMVLGHGEVPAHGFAVLWFDHYLKVQTNMVPNNFQIPFKLDVDGGILELLDAKNVVIDSISFPSAVARCSYIRIQDGGYSWGFTSVPTPGSSNLNSAVAEDRLSAPQVSVDGGLISSPIRFSVNIPEGASLYYTTDGSTPVAGMSEQSADGMFVADSTIVFRFLLAKDGLLNSPVVTRSFIKPIHDYYLPIVSLTTNPDNLYDDSIGAYVVGVNGAVGNGFSQRANINRDWERPVNIEYFVPDSSSNYSVAFNQEMDFEIGGGYTRFNKSNDFLLYRPSFKIKAKKKYEFQTSIDYPVFSSKPYIKLKGLFLRNGGQDFKARIWDATVQELVRTSGFYVDCQAVQPSHVFFNGRYIGMFNIREDTGKLYAYSNYGIDDDEMIFWENDFTMKVGAATLLNTWYDNTVKLASSPDEATWKLILDVMDVDEFCNYMALETFVGNNDWNNNGFAKNVKGFKATVDDGKIHFVLFDVDAAIGTTDMIINLMNKAKGKLYKGFKNMLAYEPFKRQFIDSYCLVGGSVFRPERCEPIIMNMAETVTPAMKFEGRESITNAKLLLSRISDREGRHRKVIQSLQTALKQNDPYKLKLTTNISSGHLLVNGLEVPAGQFDGFLFPPFSLTAAAPSGCRFSHWMVDGEEVRCDSVIDMSSLYECGTYSVEAVFDTLDSYSDFVGHGLTPLCINEVSSANDIYINDYGKKSDWIEIYNPTDIDIDLRGMFLSDNPSNLMKSQVSASSVVSTIVPPHGYKVIWCDGKESISQLHASFKLSNDDYSFVSLMAQDMLWIDSLTYDSQLRWFTFGRYPDGGNSIALMSIPTIERANKIHTSDVLREMPQRETSDAIEQIYASNKPKSSVRYYNMKGQLISPESSAESIIIESIVYRDGTTSSRKIFRRR